MNLRTVTIPTHISATVTEVANATVTQFDEKYDRNVFDPYTAALLALGAFALHYDLVHGAFRYLPETADALRLVELTKLAAYAKETR